jgi:hypothetical protein
MTPFHRSISHDRQSIVRIIAGFFIMTSLVLAHVMGQVDMSKLSWLWFTAFVGANLPSSARWT